MADVDKQKLKDEIKLQGEVVRKLKTEKAGKDKVRIYTLPTDPEVVFRGD